MPHSLRSWLPVLAVCSTLLSAALLLSATAASAELYVKRDARGVVTFTSRKPGEGSSYKVFQPRKSASFSYYRAGYSGRWYPPRARKTVYDPLIAKAASDTNLDPALVKAVVHCESAFNPSARSYKGAMGLMQLMPGTAKRFGVKNAYHPEQNLKGGTKYLRWLLDRYRGNARLAVAAYNAGEGAVDNYNGVPPYSETQEYVRRVLATQKVYVCAGRGTKNC